MGTIIARQPNGLLCRWSGNTDSITNYNMTDEEYVEYCAQQAREQALWDLRENPHFPSKFEDVIRERNFIELCLNELIEYGYCPDDYDNEQEYNESVEEHRKSLVELDELIDKMSKPVNHED